MNEIDPGNIARTAVICSHDSYLGSMPLLLTGIILEYISIILLPTQRKPTFFVIGCSTDNLLLDYFTGQKDADPA